MQNETTFKYDKGQKVKSGVASSDRKMREDGLIQARRFLKGDKEPCYLIKFKGHSGVFHVYESDIVV